MKGSQRSWLTRRHGMAEIMGSNPVESTYVHTIFPHIVHRKKIYLIDAEKSPMILYTGSILIH